MDTLPQPTTRTRRPDAPSPLPRWLRVAFFVAMLSIVNGSLVYLFTWISPVSTARFEAIRVRACESLFAPAGWPTTHDPHWTRERILESLGRLTRVESNQPVVLLLSAPAVTADTGGLLIVPEGTPLDDPSKWLSLREMLERFKACPSKQKLLILDVAMPRRNAWNGYVRDNLAQAIAQDLNDIPDADRWVIGPCRENENPEGGTILARYVRDGLLGGADGYAGERDGQVTVSELAAFVKARVGRWSQVCLAKSVTPTLLGRGADFVVALSRDGIPEADLVERSNKPMPRGSKRTGDLRAFPVAFQRQQALLLNQHGDAPEKHKAAHSVDSTPYAVGDAGRSFADLWRGLYRQLDDARLVDAERIKKRFVDDTRAKFTDAELDALVFAQLQTDARLDPGMIRLADQLLHAASKTAPRTETSLRIRQLADLAMRVEVHAWPRDAADALLRAAASAERAYGLAPSVAGFAELLDQPAQLRHQGELRMWTHGYANVDDARRLLIESAEQFERLERIQRRQRVCEDALSDAVSLLPWYVGSLEILANLREPWEKAARSARAMADALNSHVKEEASWLARVEHLETRLLAAEKHLSALRAHQRELQAPFGKSQLDVLIQRCESPNADARLLRESEAHLQAFPDMPGDLRASLVKAVRALAGRLQDRVIALDRADDDAGLRTVAPKMEADGSDIEGRARCRLMLAELAGVPESLLAPTRRLLLQCARKNAKSVCWCELSAGLHDLVARQIARRATHAEDAIDQERAQWLMPPWTATPEARLAETSGLVLDRRTGSMQITARRAEHAERCASDFRALNFESPGVAAARAFYGRPKSQNRLDVNFKLTRDVGALSEQQPYAHVWLEVTRKVPVGEFGPLELSFQRPDSAWLEIAPSSATLPALTFSTEPRTYVHKVPVKVIRKDKAERSGLPAPVGFLAEAKFEGQTWHQLVAVPIAPMTQELQILVSADPDEPTSTVNEIRLRPGKVKQPHYIYVKNLTNRMQQVQVDVKAGERTLFKSSQVLNVLPDASRKIRFDDISQEPIADLQGDITVRVMDRDRTKILGERTLKVEVLSAKDYVRIAEASYQPGFDGSGKWAVVVQSAKPVAGPAIAAQLVLPVQRIPGLIDAGGGTTHVEVPARTSSPRLLFAERLRLIPAADEEGPVYLHIDGVPRAFVYRTKFRRDGTPTQPRRDERPAIRLTAPQCIMAGAKCLVDLEVDNAPAGAKVEVALGRVVANGDFVPEASREFADAKQRRIDMQATRDALVFDAAVSDWTATFDTRAKVGSRTLRARLIDGGGGILADASQNIVIDDSPPIAKINAVPAQIKQGSTVPLLVEAGDAESGVSQVTFFLGKPDRGEIPNGAIRYKAVPVNREQTHWTVPLPVPTDRVGSSSVSVQVINHAGMVAVDTVTFEITEREPGATGLGLIQGRVVEGPRLQPNLVVILQDAKGKEIARTRTLPDGTYRFPSLPPGRYRVVCVKPESQRRAILDAMVEPDRATQADLSLAL